MAGILTFIGWLVSHWYIVAALAAIAFAVAYFFMGRALIELLRAFVEFFKTPAGQMMAIACVIVLMIATAFSTGRNYERKLCDAEDLREELKNLKADIAAKEKQIKDGEAAQARDAARASEAEKELLKLRSKVDATPANSRPCLDPDAARRVYDIK
jgi:hypothetical protein